MTNVRYVNDAAIRKTLAGALQTLPDEYLICRGQRHRFNLEEDFHVPTSATLVGRQARAAGDIERHFRCERCEVLRIERYQRVPDGLVPMGGALYREYPDGYQLVGLGIPRGVKPSGVVQSEEFRRSMSKVAKAARRKPRAAAARRAS